MLHHASAGSQLRCPRAPRMRLDGMQCQAQNPPDTGTVNAGVGRSQDWRHGSASCTHSSMSGALSRSGAGRVKYSYKAPWVASMGGWRETEQGGSSGGTVEAQPLAGSKYLTAQPLFSIVSEPHQQGTCTAFSFKTFTTSEKGIKHLWGRADFNAGDR